jgi:hypothetical protein
MSSFKARHHLLSFHLLALLTPIKKPGFTLQNARLSEFVSTSFFLFIEKKVAKNFALKRLN